MLNQLFINKNEKIKNLDEDPNNFRLKARIMTITPVHI